MLVASVVLAVQDLLGLMVLCMPAAAAEQVTLLAVPVVDMVKRQVVVDPPVFAEDDGASEARDWAVEAPRSDRSESEGEAERKPTERSEGRRLRQSKK